MVFWTISFLAYFVQQALIKMESVFFFFFLYRNVALNCKKVGETCNMADYNGICLQWLISHYQSVRFVWVSGVESRTYPWWIDSERDTAVCPFISGVHGRAQRRQLIHQTWEYNWAFWNRTKHQRYPSCIPSALATHISVCSFCRI